MGKLIKKSLLSGILIGIGIVINIKCDNSYIGAMLFSFALLTIIKNKLPLYTGQIGYWYNHTMYSLIIMLIMNNIGALISISVFDATSIEKIRYISEMKFNKSFVELFICALLCGLLIFIAVVTKDSIITVFAIMIFILSGFEHCIADFPYLIVNFSVINLLKYLTIIIGNSCAAIITNLLLNIREGENDVIPN